METAQEEKDMIEHEHLVSEGLNSVETTISAFLRASIRWVSEGLNSVETKSGSYYK